MSFPRYVYVIEVETRAGVIPQYHKVSQECYASSELAREFVKNRADKPEECSYFIFRSEKLTYSIRELRLLFGGNTK